ncbi:MAG: hypothetical protein HY073_03855 [Deltaproteobacteria bacterium]|nr:hypothetical protein [Deltaproteobacteria bacterium]
MAKSCSSESIQSIRQGAYEAERKSEGISLLEEARKKSIDLLSIVGKTGIRMFRLPLRLSIKRKVRKNLSEAFDFPEADEITERIADQIAEAAKEDPFYRRLFR